MHLDSENLVTQVRATLQALSLCTAQGEQPTTLLVGVSGGRDSVVLLHVLAGLAPTCGLNLHVIHVDHGLRSDSGEDAAFVKRLAVALGCPCHVVTLDPQALASRGDGVEAAARRARYRAFFRIASKVTPSGQVPVTAVAHHADDQAETILLHLTHGAGLRGLGGMAVDTLLPISSVANDGDVGEELREMRIVRPFLSAPRAVLAACAQVHGLTWREDATNADQTRTRNYMRHVILPALAEVNPQIVATLNRTAEVIAADWARLAALDRSALEAALAEPSRLADIESGARPERIVLNLRTFRSYDQATQRGVLRTALTLLSPAGQHDLEFNQTERVVASLSGEASTGPHPIAAGLAWSVMGAWRDRRQPMLSLHRADAIPFHPRQPLLSDGAVYPLPADGTIVPQTIEQQQDWLLTCRTAARDVIPADWDAAAAWECRLDADKVGALTLTVPRAGMTMSPTGMDGHSKKVADILGDAKIHQTLRAHWPIVVDERTQRVLWVCGLRAAVHAAVDAATVTVRHLRWEQRDPTARG